MRTTLTGIKTTGTPHLGNYVGAIRPAIAASQKREGRHYYFLADYHALIQCQNPQVVRQSTLEIAATWLALGLDTARAVFYRQSDVPEITELTWMLSCVAAKGLMNRAHAYKDAVQKNDAAGEDPDFGVTMGLFNYPVLMAADILMFKATHVPVGRDQVQHLEVARDIAQRFNHIYGKDLLVVPEAVVDDRVAVLQGLDGRKMSKSYDNTIPLFSSESKLRMNINKIITNLKKPGEPKDVADSALFHIWQAFATPEQTAWMRDQYAAGIAWGEAKRELFELINGHLAEARVRYEDLIANPAAIEAELQTGAQRARQVATPLIAQLREAVGISRLA